MLLQISFFLFGFALSAFLWSQQGAAANAVIILMAVGLFFYLFTVFASVTLPECPFQTPTSLFLRFIWRRLQVTVAGWKESKEGYSSPDPGKLKETQALTLARSMRWILNTSTDPEVITSAAWLLPTIKWTPEVNVTAVCSRLLQTFTACFHADALLSHSARQRALACGRALHHLICNETIETVIPSDFMRFDDWSDWRHLSLPWGLERCKEYFVQYTTTLETDYKDNARLALQLAVVTGCEGFLKPTDVALIWDGVFHWKDDSRTAEDFDWLVDFLVHFWKVTTRNFHAMGDALLALSAMRGMGSVTRRDNHLDAIIFAMDPNKPSRLRHTALRAIFDARFKLVEIVDQEKGEFREKLLKELAPAMFTAAKPIASQRYDDDPDALFNPRRDDCYLRLIFTLAKQSDWSAHLKRAGHMERCTSLLEHVIKNSSSMSSVTTHPYYLAGTLIRMNASGGYRSSLGRATPASALVVPTNIVSRTTRNLAALLSADPGAPTPPGFLDNISEKEWWELLKGAWWAMHLNDLHLKQEAVEVLPDIVTYTLNLLETQPAQYDAASLVRSVDRIYEALDDGEAKLCVKRLQDALGNMVAGMPTRLRPLGSIVIKRRQSIG
ncbi:uncharacterized protein EDB93DRAFT_1247396 [Suillus bovinus]|uniref:uncharacterized protein n=1 Tax=Suillus bovinus TaxID=48563 RepID=UPI001B878EF1|nr:uncharacterized protein EDB93DRAFT_1247396 [Suillus bovinus]KAG2156694.1 hypothetical protein EDB93DRAFT_1247396 [Suillus bovinus]